VAFAVILAMRSGSLSRDREDDPKKKRYAVGSRE